MDWLNYHHLFYFWTTAREGSITAACKRLLLAPATVSAQIRELEGALGEQLFIRTGRRLLLTETGRRVFRYADEIFSLGREMVDVIKGRSQEGSVQVNIGVNDVLPKPVVYQILKPILDLPETTQISCVEGTPLQLLPPLASLELDVVLSDAPADPRVRIRAFSHLLGESGVTIFAARGLARKWRKRFPRSLDGAPALLPAPGSALRIALDKWFELVDIRPKIVGEFEDIALLSVFGQQGAGFFAGYDVSIPEITRAREVEPLGKIADHQEQFYAITVERRIKHPAVAAITESARASLFR
jgi:LysR family transcriptional regulator, transcriptional activator of nhaA